MTVTPTVRRRHHRHASTFLTLRWIHELNLLMPLLALFSKRNRSSSKVSAVAHSNSNISLDDEDYVSVATHSIVSHHAQSSSPSSKLALPFRKKAVSEAHSHSQYSDPLLDPPPRRSSIFQTYQDDQNAIRSTRSLPGEAEPTTLPQQPSPPPLPGATKRSMFSWSSHKERNKPPAKPGSSEADASFNLRSFRHVRPDSPGLGSSGTRSSSQAPVLPPIPTTTFPSQGPVLPPIPTTTFPSPPVSFQVTSRRPRAESFSDLTSPGSSPLTSQQKMAAGAFRQAARRSSTSLSLTDSPKLSPVCTSLDDRPPVSLLPPSQAVVNTPPRSRPPSSTYTPKPTTSQFSPPVSSSYRSISAAPPSPKPTSVVKPPRIRTNAFADSSSSSSSSEEDDDDDEESINDPTVRAPRISRKRTITQNKGQAQTATLPPLSSSVRQQILRAAPPVTSSSVVRDSFTTNGVPRPQSSLAVYGSGTRPRASLSVGALTPTAKETRASMALAANARSTNSKQLILLLVMSSNINFHVASHAPPSHPYRHQ